MARYYLQVCANPDCPSKGEKESHKMVAGHAGEWTGICQKCGITNSREAPPVTKSAHKWVYPYMHSGTGVTFESESHQKAVEKKMGLEKI